MTTTVGDFLRERRYTWCVPRMSARPASSYFKALLKASIRKTWDGWFPQEKNTR